MSFDFDHAVQMPFRMQPGLRRLAPSARHLTPLRPGARHLREKIAVLQAWPHEALLCQAGFDAGPALQALARRAHLEHPQAWSVDEQGHWCAHHLGCRVSPDGDVQVVHAVWNEVPRCLNRLPATWRRTALLLLAFAEDLAIIDGRQATLPWLAVCLPSQWAPADKIGRHFGEVHAAVADNALLVQAGAHLMRLVTGSERWERFVWNISAHSRLHAHPARTDPLPWSACQSPEDVVARAWWRTERQTFLPLPELGQAIFTIQVEVCPLREALDSAEQAQRLHDSLASMSAAVLAYRHLGEVQDALLSWLRTRVAA